MSEQGDTGGLSREFWRLFVEDIIASYCVGERGLCVFDKNSLALKVWMQHIVHEVFALLCI